LTQQQLADKAGCQKETVSELERGKWEPSWVLALELADALGVNCRDFRSPTG
jgi:DNA-binding XRE family transcriptional regulator